MKKYPKVVQCDKRGQIVIPKDLRLDLGIDEGTAFWMYSISDEGLFLKKINPPELEEHKELLAKLKEKAKKIGVDSRNIDRAEKNYKKTKKGRLELL